MRRTSLGLIFMAFVFGLPLTSGCAEEPLNDDLRMYEEQELAGTCEFLSVQKLSVGLTIYKAFGDELCGSYRSGDNVIHFQTIRGEDLIYEENTIDPEAPDYVVSTRIMDQSGNPIAVAMGDLSDKRVSSWLEPLEELAGPNIDPEISFDLAQDAFELLSETLETNTFDDEITILKRRSITAAPSNNDDDTLMHHKSSSWRYWIQIMSKDALFNGNFADHSAVIVNLRRPDGSIFNYVTCNHGTCADSPTMTMHCQKVVYTSSQRTFSILPCDSVSSYGFTSGYHVCNDDTMVQYNMIAYGNPSLSTCTDSYFRLWALPATRQLARQRRLRRTG